jgi:hypothetical protein
MAEIPSRPIIDSQHSFKLIGGHALARLADEEHGDKPLRQGEMRIVEDRASSNGELIAARFGIAVILVTFKDRGEAFAAALWAAYSFGPAQVLKVIAALLVITKTLYQFTEVDCFCHRITHA